MKLPALNSNNRRATPQDGVALVLVLGMLVLLSGLLVAFLTTATTERTSTQAASDGSSVRQIADSTTNLVIGLIREATSPTDSKGAANDKLTWASQPGAIRTYSGQLATTASTYPVGGSKYPNYSPGADDYVFKLYSADRLKVNASGYSDDLKDEVDVIEKWNRLDPDPDYTDLNEPVLSPRYDLDESGQTVDPHYPVINPRARYTKEDAYADDPKSSAVEGFDAKITTDKTLKIASSEGDKSPVPYLPMPVKWLYVLRDGTVGSETLATESNPIVGRTAFWTDDESCKLNINTASEGTYWDTPTASSIQESGVLSTSGVASGVIDFSSRKLSFAASQPIRGEYQRYPGHPLTTCLSPVFGWLYGLPSSYTVTTTASYPFYPDNKLYADFKDAIYSISPFLPRGNPTTQGARWNSDPDATGNANWYDTPRIVDGIKYWGDPISEIRTKHLYATVDELLFVPKRNTGGDNARAVLNGKLTPSALERMRFFLTATSRAPELNLFGRPRVTAWPVNRNFDLRTKFDDLFAFTSTIYKTPENDLSKDKVFHLTRSNAKDDTEDYSGNPRNEKMYEYLQKMMRTQIPGFGGTFLAKYPLDCNQILTEIFDYMRTVNLTDTGTASRQGNIFAPYTPRFYPEGIVHNYTRTKRSNDWAGQVTPLKISDGSAEGTMGLGRFLVISEAAIVFNRVNIPPTPPATQPTQAIQATLLLEMASPMAGLPGLRDTYWTKIYPKPDPGNLNLPLRKLQIRFPGATEPIDARFCTTNPPPNGNPGEGGGLINIVNVSNHEVAQGRAYMPTLGYANQLHWLPEHLGVNPNYVGEPSKDPTRNNTMTYSRKFFKFPIPTENYTGNYKRQTVATVNPLGAGTAAFYPYISEPIPIPTATPPLTTFSFLGPTLIVEIHSGEAPPTGTTAGPTAGDPRSKKVQTVELHFPDVSAALPLPTDSSPSSFVDRLDTSNGDNGGRNRFIDQDGAADVVRSIELSAYTPGNPNTVEPQEGDLRMAAARKVVPASFYTPRGGSAKYNSTTRRVHGLTWGHADPEPSDVEGAKSYSGGNGSSFAMNGQSRDSKRPILPIGINGVKRADNGPGDWDRGLSKHLDGAMGNKVDEGNLKFDYNDGAAAGKIPYFRGRGIEETGQTFFSPNRQFPSPVMFGSLPTGVKSDKPWQTLLFHPDTSGHPGAKSPPDHLLLDLFHMPIVEPFAISEPFSTMGKVNMNYVIAPFGYAAGDTKGSATNPNSTMKRSYIRRDTALRGVLKSVYLMAVLSSQNDGAHEENPHGVNIDFRFPINLDKTIEEFEFRLNNQSKALDSRSTTLFRSASEICDIDLFPVLTTGSFTSTFATYWETTYAQTGDNMRERPYAHIYPRLTTKSNVFTVYMRCQAIRKSPKSNANEFDPKRDAVVGEYRGSATIERFIDPNDQQLKNYNHLEERAEPYYRFRIIGTKHFAPR